MTNSPTVCWYFAAGAVDPVPKAFPHLTHCMDGTLLPAASADVLQQASTLLQED